MEKIRKTINNLFGKYWGVLAVIIYFSLTGIYNEFAENRDVLWNTYIKTVREGFFVFVLYTSIRTLPNSLSILSFLGVIGYSLSLTLFRFWSAIKSNLIYKGVISPKQELLDALSSENLKWNWYNIYFEFMKDIDTRHMFTIVIILILITIHYLNKR